MKLEYLADGSPDCPLLRMYDFTTAEAEQWLESAVCAPGDAALLLSGDGTW